MSLPPAAAKAHDWTITAATMADPAVALVVAVCRRCGLMRSEVAAPRRDSQIDLTGECNR